MSNKLQETLEGLRAKYRPGAVARKTTYYLSLGDAAGEKWTVTLTPDACDMTPGRAGDADCVLKMPAEMFMRLLGGTYKPGPMDVFSGKIKTNDVGLLMKLQQAFAA
jgi:long-chain acyl-CoA synthetase